MDAFHFTNFAQEIIFAEGALNQISNAIDHFGWQRLLLCSTRSQRHNGNIDLLERQLDKRLVAIFATVQPHVFDVQVAEITALASEHKIDAIIGLGGGSPIGMAKAVSFELEEQRSSWPAKSASPIDQPRVPTIAIPTTYAGSEMTPTYGITHQSNGTTRKITVTDVKIVPKLTIYDPLLTLDLPPELTASTGINALAHCIEALYSITRNPLASAAARSGIRSIFSALPRCYIDGKDREARTEMLKGAFLAGTALSHVKMGLHHGLCHILGGSAGVPHGIANSIILPHAMGFNIDIATPQLAEVAEEMGIARAGRSDEEVAEAGIQAISKLIGQMHLPQQLRSVGIQEADLPHLAQLALQSSAVKSNPKPIPDAAQIEAVLRVAW